MLDLSIIGARQATKIRAEPATHACDEEAHGERGGRWLLCAVGLGPQKDADDREAGHQDSCPNEDGGGHVRCRFLSFEGLQPVHRS
jgi:hypothetical protein